MLVRSWLTVGVTAIAVALSGLAPGETHPQPQEVVPVVQLVQQGAAVGLQELPVSRQIKADDHVVASAVHTASYPIIKAKRCGKTGLENVFTLDSSDFSIKLYRVPVAKDPKGKANRCVILWSKRSGTGKLALSNQGKKVVRTKVFTKSGQSIQVTVGPKGVIEGVTGWFKRPGKNGKKSKVGPYDYWL